MGAGSLLEAKEADERERTKADQNTADKLLEVVVVSDLCGLVGCLTLGATAQEGLEAGEGDDDDGEGHLDDAERVLRGWGC
jgi:hypothetical protein